MYRRMCFVLSAALLVALAGHAFGQTVPAGGWTEDATLGSATPGSSVSPEKGVYEVTGNGNDIWDAADAGQYLYKELVGDGSMTARVVDDGDGSNGWAKGGVMIRQSTEPGSTHSFMCITATDGNGSSWQGRLTEGGGSENSDAPSVIAEPYWVKIERVGDELSGFISPDGEDWTQMGSARTIAMQDPVLIGLAVTSHAAGELRTYTFDNISFTGEVSGEKDPGAASIPSPVDEGVDVPRDVTLGWAAGDYPGTHDVYLGKVFDDVNDASRANPMGVLVSQGQADTAYAAGILEFGQTYYWRVDEVNSVGGAIFKTDVWSFTVEPFTYAIENVIATSNAVSDAASSVEKIVDGSGLNAAGQHSTEAADMWLGLPAGDEPITLTFEFDQVHKLHEMKVWNYNVQFELMLGFGLSAVTVEYSENGADWTVLGDVAFNQATTVPTYEANTTVAFDGVAAKFVKFTVNDNHGMLTQYGLSEVQFMQVPAAAREPQPSEGAAGVEVGATLSWRAGREAVSHEVYVSTDEAAVADGTALVDTVGQASFTPGNLEFGMTYFWKISEVNEADAISVWEGPVWSFATQEYAAIDDMESYTDDEGSRIYESWVDGYGVASNGSQVGYLDSPFAETSVVNGGGQSMPLFYDNTGGANSSEAVKDLGGMNLNANGADSLRLFVSGMAPAFYEGADGTILMNGIGADIWDAADQFRFAYKQLSGNGSLIARVDSLDNSPNEWVKAGVMIRQDTAVGAVHSFMAITGGGGNGASWQGRETANAASVNADADADNPITAPYWVRIDRAGDTLTGFVSADGETWTPMGDPRTIAMDSPALIGLALTSHNVNQVTGAVFSNVSLTGASGAWQIAEIGATQVAGNDPASIYVALGNSVVTHPSPVITGLSGWTEWVIPLSEFGNVSNVQSMTIGVEGAGTGQIFIDDIGFGRAAAVVESAD